MHSITLWSATVFIISLGFGLAVDPILSRRVDAQEAAPASGRIRYVPSNRGAATRTLGAGKRGDLVAQCLGPFQSEPVVLTLLAADPMAATAVDRPTLTWHLSQEIPVEIEFSLIQTDSGTPIYNQLLSTEASGLHQLQIPSTAPSLEPDQVYQWSMVLNCDPSQPGSLTVASAELVWIPPDPAETWPEEAHEQALHDAEAGYWYDAIDSLTKACAEDPDSLQILADWQALLPQGGIESAVTGSCQPVQVIKGSGPALDPGARSETDGLE